MTRRLLIVDDEETIRWALRELFMQDGWMAHCAEDGNAAAELIERHLYDFMITDLKMPGRPGVELVRKARLRNPKMGVIVLTGYASLDTAVESLRLRAWDYLSKPCDIGLLKKRIDEFFRSAEHSQDGAAARRPLTTQDLDEFLDGAGTELMSMESVSTQDRIYSQLSCLMRALDDLGISQERAAELLQPCVEMAAGAKGETNVQGRVGLMKGFLVIGFMAPRAHAANWRKAAEKVGDLFHVDARIIERDGLCSFVLCEAL